MNTGNEMQLVMKIYSLPYHVRLKMFQELALTRKNDQNLDDKSLNEAYFERANKMKKVPQMWKWLENYEKENNPKPEPMIPTPNSGPPMLIHILKVCKSNFEQIASYAHDCALKYSDGAYSLNEIERKARLSASRITNESPDADEKRRAALEEEKSRYKKALEHVSTARIRTTLSPEGKSWIECIFCGAKTSEGFKPDHGSRVCELIADALAPATQEKK